MKTKKTKLNKACSTTTAITVFLSLAVAADGATTIDFNDGASGTTIGNFYSTQGVTFLNGEWSDFSTGFTPHPDSDGLRLVGNGFESQPKVGNPIEFTFSDPVESISIVANNVNANGARLDVYDSTVGGTLLASDQVIGASGALDSNFILSVSASGIRRGLLYQPFSVEGEGVLFDNLDFSVIPEPSSALFFGIGSLCLLACRRVRE